MQVAYFYVKSDRNSLVQNPMQVAYFQVKSDRNSLASNFCQFESNISEQVHLIFHSVQNASIFDQPHEASSAIYFAAAI